MGGGGGGVGGLRRVWGGKKVGNKVGIGGRDRIKVGRMKENTLLDFCAVKFILYLVCIVLTTISWYFCHRKQEMNSVQKEIQCLNFGVVCICIMTSLITIFGKDTWRL